MAKTPTRTKKPKIKGLPTIAHRVENLSIEFTQRGQKRKLLKIQRYRKPLTIEETDISKNPDKISFAVITNQYGDRLEIYAYKNNPEMGFISVNGRATRAEPYQWRKIQSGIMKLGKYLGVLK